MAAPVPRRRVATVLFIDIVGSTALATELGDAHWRMVLARFRQVVRRELKRCRGREQDTAGDSFYATFAEPAQALRAAATLSAAVQEIGLDVRAGLHTGECEEIDGKLTGIAVHIGARVMALAGAAEVLATRTDARPRCRFGRGIRGSRHPRAEGRRGRMAPLPPGVDRGATAAAARAGGRRAAPGRGRRRKRAAAQVAARRGSGRRRRRGCGRRFVLGVRGQLQRWCRKPAPDRPVDRPGHLDHSGQSDRLWLRRQPVGRRRNALGAGRGRRPDDRGPCARQRRASPHVPPAPRRGRLRDRVGGGLGRPERHRARRAERRGADRAGRSPRRAERAPRGDHPPARRPRQRLDRRRRRRRLGARGRRNADSDRSRPRTRSRTISPAARSRRRFSSRPTGTSGSASAWTTRCFESIHGRTPRRRSTSHSSRGISSRSTRRTSGRSGCSTGCTPRSRNSTRAQVEPAQPLGLAGNPTEAALARGSIWVAAGKVVDRVVLASGVRTTVPLPKGTHATGIAVDPSTGTIWADNSRSEPGR